MQDNKIEGILNGVSNIIEKLGDLAEKSGYQKPTGHGAYHANPDAQPTAAGTIQELATTLEETTQHWVICAHVADVKIDQVQLDAYGSKLQIKVMQDARLLYKEIELPTLCRIQNMELSCNKGQLRIHCVKT